MGVPHYDFFLSASNMKTLSIYFNKYNIYKPTQFVSHKAVFLNILLLQESFSKTQMIGKPLQTKKFG